MSDQIQYNYYNTVTTKIDDHTFIFRGKRNSPNLVLPNSDSYVSAKLTVFPNEGFVEIEHEPITNYNKRAIIRFPLQLDIGSNAALGTSQELNLNSLISKSIQFDIDNTGDVIRLNPIGNSSVEGFCSKKKVRDDINKMIDSKLDSKLDDKIRKHLNEVPHGCECNSSNSRGGGGGGGSGGSSGSNQQTGIPDLIMSSFGEPFTQRHIKEGMENEGCVATTENEITKMGYVFSTNPGTEKSVYHVAVMGVIWFVISFFVGRTVIGWLYEKFAKYLYSKEKKNNLDCIEFWGFLILIIITIVLWVFSSKDPKKIILNESAYWMTIFIFSLLYFIFEKRTKLGDVIINDRNKWFNLRSNENQPKLIWPPNILQSARGNDMI